MTTTTMTDGPDRNRPAYYDKPGLQLRLLQMLLHTEDAHQEALLGDLLEERAAGRSRFWFWGQVAYAAIFAALRDARVSRWKTLRAIVVGWFFAQAVASVALFAVFAYAVPASVPTGQFMVPGTALYIIIIVAAGAGAWAVTRMNPQHEGPMLIAFLASALLAAAASLAWGVPSGQLDVLPPTLSIIVRFLVVPMAIVAGGTLGRRVDVIRTA